jgi:hypothetical protein
MSNVVIYHPGTEAQVAVPEESLPQMRRSGWLLLSEHQENEAAREKREAAEAAAASKTSGKGDK